MALPAPWVSKRCWSMYQLQSFRHVMMYSMLALKRQMCKKPQAAWPSNPVSSHSLSPAGHLCTFLSCIQPAAPLPLLLKRKWVSSAVDILETGRVQKERMWWAEPEVWMMAREPENYKPSALTADEKKIREG